MSRYSRDAIHLNPVQAWALNLQDLKEHLKRLARVMDHIMTAGGPAHRGPPLTG